MIELKYEYQEKVGTLKLAELSGYSGKTDILGSIETSDLQYSIIEHALVHLSPEVDSMPVMYACERGGERNLISPSSEASRLGFTKLEAVIDSNKISILT